MKITKLEYQKKDPNRVNIYVDDNFLSGINVDDILRLGIYKGQELTQTEINKIIAESEFGKLFNSALNFLSFRPRSEWEVRKNLERKTMNQDPELIDQVITKLKKIDQINDESFIKWYIDQRKTFKPLGKSAIRHQLLQKGIASKTIGNILQENSDMSEFQLALRAFDKKFKNINNDVVKYGLQRTRMKTQRFLAGRGFSWEIIKDVVANRLKKEYNDT